MFIVPSFPVEALPPHPPVQDGRPGSLESSSISVSLLGCGCCCSSGVGFACYVVGAPLLPGEGVCHCVFDSGQLLYLHEPMLESVSHPCQSLV